MRYLLQPSDSAGLWVCTDTENLVVCVFKNKDFNESQTITLLEDFNPANVTELATILREMADWLRANHYNTLF